MNSLRQLVAIVIVLIVLSSSLAVPAIGADEAPVRRTLYVAVPGIRNYLERDGHGVLAFVNVIGLLGFEVGDLTTGKKLHRVEVQGYKSGIPKRHGCPSHGLGLTPDEKELWVCDGPNQRLHIFEAAVMPPKQVASIALRDDPGWITFSLDGKYAYPSTGEVIEVATREIVTTLKDETGTIAESEKLREIDFANGAPAQAGSQFGVGRVR